MSVWISSTSCNEGVTTRWRRNQGPRKRPRLAALSGSQNEPPRPCRGNVTVNLNWVES